MNTVMPQVINSTLLIRLPADMSARLPSRGMVMGEGTLNGVSIKMPLEPDGAGGHWFSIDQKLMKQCHAQVGEATKLELEATDHWIEPELPEDIKKAFFSDPVSDAMWKRITVKARWEWLRWIRATNNPQTRAKRIRVSIDKMHKGMRRPCCFNQSMCTVPDVAKNGVLSAEKI